MAPPDDAIAAYQDALSRGHLATARRDHKAALESYRAAAALAGQRPLPHVLVGRALLSLKRNEPALEAFEEALLHDPSDPGALAGKAEALQRLGRREAAAQVRAELERVEQAGRPGRVPAGSTPAEVLAIAGDRAWHDGRRDVAVEQWLAAARAHAGEGHIDAALDLCQRALLADPGAGAIHLEMSRHYLAGGLVGHAVERLELLARLVELAPDAGLRDELARLVHESADRHPQLAALAARLDEPSPA
ncbi:MAG TPA: hypothetical protein VM305_07760 [Candidatus Limnocylindrales bacterium]|nr:hypothetical protein [Candidatus Limnocylindrales bacterium]